MELSEFTKETLVQIIQGVVDAQHDIFEKFGISDAVEGGGQWETGQNQKVNFEVAVSAETGKNGTAKISVITGFFGGKAGGDVSATTSQSAVVRFTVPIVIPDTTVENGELKQHRKQRPLCV